MVVGAKNIGSDKFVLYIDPIDFKTRQITMMYFETFLYGLSSIHGFRMPSVLGKVFFLKREKDENQYAFRLRSKVVDQTVETPSSSAKELS